MFFIFKDLIYYITYLDSERKQILRNFIAKLEKLVKGNISFA